MADVPPKFFTAREKDVVVHVRLTPRGGRDALEGTETLANGQCVLKARVRAVAEDGKANDALMAMLAKALKIPASHVKVVSGATSRHKTLALDGEPEALAQKLERMAQERARA